MNITIATMYDELPGIAQATIQSILVECKKSKATSSFVLDVARKQVLPVLSKVNPGDAEIQSVLVSGKPIDIRFTDLDWETTFDLLSKEKPTWFQKILWDVWIRPSLGFIIGIKIPQELTKNREQRLIFGKWLAIAAIIHFSEIAN